MHIQAKTMNFQGRTMDIQGKQCVFKKNNECSRKTNVIKNQARLSATFGNMTLKECISITFRNIIITLRSKVH